MRRDLLSHVQNTEVGREPINSIFLGDGVKESRFTCYRKKSNGRESDILKQNSNSPRRLHVQEICFQRRIRETPPLQNAKYIYDGHEIAFLRVSYVPTPFSPISPYRRWYANRNSPASNNTVPLSNETVTFRTCTSRRLSAP